jgi:hypothetical protein
MEDSWKQIIYSLLQGDKMYRAVTNSYWVLRLCILKSKNLRVRQQLGNCFLPVSTQAKLTHVSIQMS